MLVMFYFPLLTSRKVSGTVMLTMSNSLDASKHMTRCHFQSEGERVRVDETLLARGVKKKSPNGSGERQMGRGEAQTRGG